MARFYQPGMASLQGWYPIGAGWDEFREVIPSEPGVNLSVPGVLEFLLNDNDPSNNSVVGNSAEGFRIEVTIR